MLLDLRRHPRQTIDLIRTIRRRQGFGPGIIVMTRRGDVVTTLEAGADTLVHCPGTDASLIAASIIGLGRLMGVLPAGRRGHGAGRQTDTGCGARP
jgi:DNA-binding response OmpR family regulator